MKNIDFLHQNLMQKPKLLQSVREAIRVRHHDEAKSVLDNLEGVPRIVAGLLYGSGLSLREALTLRVKDIEFDRKSITVRSGKGEIYPAFP